MAQTASINIRDFDAVGDGSHHDGEAIHRAIAAAADRPVGRVVVPPGVYVVGTVALRSGLTLELQTGATLLASTDPAHYPPRPTPPGFPPQHDRQATGQRRHLICGDDLKHVRICGGGVIDGNVAAFTPGWNDRPLCTWIGASRRPFVPMIDFTRCEDLRLEGVTIRNSPGWTCHLNQCDRVWVTGVRLHNDLYAGNSDGFDVNGCRDVFFHDCHIETGDDAIVLKTFRDSRSCERITVSNCVMRSSCAAFKIGTETFHDFRQIAISNCVVYRSSRAIQLMSQDGATIEDVTVSNLVIDTDSGIPLNRPIHLDVHRRRAGKHILETGEAGGLGAMRRVRLDNLTIRSDGRILMTAADGARLEQIALTGVTMHMPWIEDPADHAEADVMQSSPGNPDARLARAAIVAEHIDDLRLDDVTVTWPTGPEALGDDYQPKYHRGRLVRDPRTRFEPMPPFNALWARRLRRARLDLNHPTAFTDDHPPIHTEDGE